MKTHGMTDTPIYRKWAHMKTRCNNRLSVSYQNYGGKGIKVCEEWNSFENFYNDMADGFSEELTLERIDFKKGYSKENCTWIPSAEQARNKSNVILYEYKGFKRTLVEISKDSGVNYETLIARVHKYGWSLDRAVSEPIRRNQEYSGITWDSSRKKWRATVKREGKQLLLGRFETKELAKEARNKFLCKLK